MGWSYPDPQPAFAEIRDWLPGDSLYDATVSVPADLPAGQYDLAIGLLDPRSDDPRVKLAIEGRGADGWYRLAEIKVQP